MDIFQYKDMRKNHYKFTFPLQMSQPKLETPLENAIKAVKSGAMNAYKACKLYGKLL